MRAKLQIALMCILILMFCFVQCAQKKEIGIGTYQVKRTDFKTAVTEIGELDAVHSNMVNAPNISWRLGTLKVIEIIEDGTKVKTGDVLVRFDPSDIQKQVVESQAQLDIAKAEVRKAKASQASEINDLESQIEIAEIEVEIAKLNLKQAAFESEIRKKELELALENQLIALDKRKQDLENKKRVHQEEMNKLNLTVSLEKSKLEESQATLERLTVKAPAPGIVIIQKNWNTGNKIQVEDQLWRGYRMISLPDLDTLQAKLQINEVDIGKIQLHQNATIRTDALPDTSFSGYVDYVAVLAKKKDRDSNVKVFDVIVRLTEKDTTMMPGMTVRSEIEVNRISDVLQVPLDCLFKKDNQSIVYVKKGRGFQPREVVLGASNDDFVIIQKGLKEGDEVAMIDPTLLQSDQSQKKKESS